MPGMPGTEFLGKVKEMSPETINIIITGFATVETAVEAMKKGAFDYVCKPFTPEELEIVVEKGLETRMLRRAADEAEKEKERFVLTIYHQLKSPVGIIQGYLKNLLEGEPADEPQRIAVLHRCLKRADTLRQLLEDLLSLSRLQARKPEQDMEVVRVGDVLNEVVECWRVRAREKGIKLQLDLEGDLPSVKGYKQQLTHLFENLIDNAIRYNTENGRVEIRAIRNQGDVRVQVSDTGIGVAEQDMPKIFEEFYRCQRDETRMIPGTGLGLSIVQRIAETHGGRVDVDSEVGKGTTFIVRLPVCE
jgi:two-component system sensor histidine kinase/response regulator